tara:strand:+ start:1829 stop:2122 length:294 start_codon:yes stop_codon:yes gene_type:complete
MEWALATFGGKFCCIFASGCGGVTNVLTKRTWGWGSVKDVGLALIVGWIAAEFFIPPVMKHFALDMTWGPAIAFVVGYSGIRLLPKLEGVIMNRISK